MRRFGSFFTTASTLALLLAPGGLTREAHAQDAEFCAQSGLDVIGAEAAYAGGWTGSGVIVGIIDSGIFAAHPEFLGALVPGYNATTGSDLVPEGDGHGTHVAGIIGARRDGFGMHGVAPGSLLLPIKLVDISNEEIAALTQVERERMFSQHIARALDAAIARGASIVNGSIGLNPDPSDRSAENVRRTMVDLTPAQIETIFPEFVAAGRRIAAADRIVVFSTGNESDADADILAGLPLHYPELAGSWLAVGAADLNGVRTSYSNACGRAALWCLWAPGGGDAEVDGVYSVGHENEHAYVRMSGTSMAAPHVSGALAVLKEKFSNLSGRELVQLVLLTAHDMGDAGVDEVFGHGGLNLGRAIAGPVIANGERLTVNAGTSGTMIYTLGLSGLGGIVKTGTGTVVLAGTSSYAGATIVEAGKLAVNGTLASVVQVQSGARLSGSGSVGGIAAGTGAVLAPGASIGDLSVTGDLVLSPSSITEIEVDASGRSDRLLVGGNVALGGSLSILALDPEAAFGPRTSYAFLKHDGVRAGTFERVEHAFTLLTPSLAYNSNDVSLTLRRAPVQSVATQPNSGIAKSLDGIIDAGNIDDPTLTNFFQKLYGTSGPQGQQFVNNVLGSASGDMHANNGSLFNGGLNAFTGALLNRSGSLSFGLGAPPAAYASFGSAEVPEAALSSSVWGRALAGTGSSDASSSAPRASLERRGFLFGIDGAVSDDVHLGLAGGYTRQTVRTPARGGVTAIDQFDAALYGTADLGVAQLYGSLGYARQSADSRRGVLLAGTARARFDADLFHGTFEASRGFGDGETVVSPFARLGFVHRIEHGFTETGIGGLGLVSRGQTTTTFDATVGVGLATTVSLGSGGGSLIPYVRAAWRHGFGDVSQSRTFSFAGGGNPFTIAGAPAQRNSALLDAGMRVDVNERISLDVGYSGSFAHRSRDHSFNAGFSMKF